MKVTDSRDAPFCVNKACWHWCYHDSENTYPLFEVYQYANPVRHHPLSGASPSSFWLTNHVRGSSLAAVDAVSCDVGWGRGMCRCVILQQVWSPGSGDLGLKRYKEIPLKEQRVSRFTWFPVTRTRVASPHRVTSSAEAHIFRFNTFLREHRLTASTKNNKNNRKCWNLTFGLLERPLNGHFYCQTDIDEFLKALRHSLHAYISIHTFPLKYANVLHTNVAFG